MKYLLDTNICIHFFKGKFNLEDRLSKVGIENCAISEITLAELVFGAEKSLNPQKNHKLIEAFTRNLTILPIFDSIYKYGKEKARLEKSGTPISDFDLLIGCTATENSLIMVTENIREFGRIEGINLENRIERPDSQVSWKDSVAT
jgi:tRNA(fMet)-specific endonuclease VapC